MIYHMAEKVNEQGGVKALCYSGNRSISLRTASWTIRPEAVTCEKCRAIMNAQKKGGSDAVRNRESGAP